jgi:hypothetical protein
VRAKPRAGREVCWLSARSRCFWEQKKDVLHDGQGRSFTGGGDDFSDSAEVEAEEAAMRRRRVSD